MLNSISSLIKAFGVALPSDDEASKVSYEIVPRVGQSSRKSYFQKELEAASQSGEWKSKILLLPDVGKFEIKLRAYNAALLANGILSRYPSEVTLYKNRNRRMNRYLIYCYWRLFKHLNKANYWNIAKEIIRNSSVYKTVCVHSVDRNIYRTMRQNDFLKLMRRVDGMRANFHFRETLWSDNVTPILAMRHYIKFYRVYIPKNENSVRPLGVPTKAWRIYQKMWLLPILGYTGHIIPKGFHGYIPSRGTGTAWQQILKEVIHAQNIFELDFRGFFPSIPTAELSYLLYKQAMIPLDVVVYLHYMNNSLPMFMFEEEQLPEIRYHGGHEKSIILDQLKLKLSKPVVSERLIDGINTTGLREPGSNYVAPQPVLSTNRTPYGYMKPNIIPGIIPSKLPNTLKTGNLIYKELEPKMLIEPYVDEAQHFDLNYQMLKWQGARGIPLGRMTGEQRTQMWKDLADSVVTKEASIMKAMLGETKPFGIGLPQGATLSPYLSILYLEMVLRKLGVPKEVKYLFYADDGLFYSDNYDVLSKWIRDLSGHKALPTTLAHYNITFAPEKSKYVKVNGEWKESLKFLGLRFTYNGSLSQSILQAETRPKLGLDLKLTQGSRLIFDKSELVAFDYISRLIKRSKSYLEYRIAISKTPAFKYFYTKLLELQGFSVVELGYLYFLFKLTITGMFSFVTAFLSESYLLRNAGVLREMIPNLRNDDLARDFVLTSKLDPSNREKILETVRWLKGGYDNSFFHPSPSNMLLRRLSQGPGSVEVGAFAVLPIDGIDEVLKRLISASYLFLSENLEKYQIFRDTGRGFKEMVPLDLFRFIYSVLVPFFSLLTPIYHMLGARPVEEIKRIAKFSWVHSKYQLDNKFRNLADSRYFGLIMARMYSGSWLDAGIEQSFDMDCEEGSLADFLLEHDHNKDMNIFVGSSYAFHEIVRLNSYLKRSPRTMAKFKLFQEGFLTEDSWTRDEPVVLDSPSLASEFPGMNEPRWHLDKTS